MNNNSVGHLFVEAAKKKLMADISDAEAKIKLYTTVPVGVGEHPNITEEILKAAEAGAHAQEVLDFLENALP